MTNIIFFVPWQVGLRVKGGATCTFKYLTAAMCVDIRVLFMYELFSMLLVGANEWHNITRKGSVSLSGMNVG